MNNKEKDTIQLNKTKLRALLPAIKKLNGFLTKTAPGKCKINADADFDEEFMKSRWTKSDLEILRQIIREEVQPIKDDMAVLKQDNEILKKDNEILKQDNQIIKNEIKDLKADKVILKQDKDIIKKDNEIHKEDNKILKQEIEFLKSDNQFIKVKFSELKEMIEAIQNCPTIKKELEAQKTKI